MSSLSLVDNSIDIAIDQQLQAAHVNIDEGGVP
jgi:hypothetical protein